MSTQTMASSAGNPSLLAMASRTLSVCSWSPVMTTRGLVIMAPGIAIPDTKILLAQREFVAMQFGSFSKQLRNGDRGILQCGPQRRGVGGGRALGRTRPHSRMRCSHGVEGGHHAPTFASASV